MSKCLLQKNSFINIQPFMVINLGLDGVSLLIYALIYGHTVNKGVFYGSLEYMAQWCHCTTRNITNCINTLEGKGLIRRKKTPKGCFYMTEKVKTDLPEYEEEEIENPFKDEYITEESSEKKEKTSKDLEKSSCEDRKKVPENTEESSSNILDDNLDNKLDLNSSTNSSPQPNESSYKPFVPQEENSKSHSVRQADRKTKKKTSKTDKPSFPQEYYTQCYNAYFANWKILFEKNILSVEKPAFNYRENQSILYNAFIKYGFEDVLKAVTESINHHWLVYDKHYQFSCIFGPKELPNLINKTYDNYYGSKQPRSYQQPRRAVPSSQYL